MTSEQISRTSIDSSRHGAIDIELKSLKLYTRQLQSVLTTHVTELQILHRLYYKNKNQHRGALFWRNVVEIRRFLGRVENLNLLDSINGLRSMFYDTQNINSAKGPWTHCPDASFLLKHSYHCQNAMNLVEKMADRCLTAYRSFHRSLQSAAFLQILLMFVAIASRTRILAIELKDILHQIKLCVARLISVATVPIFHQGEKIYDSGSTSLPASHPMELGPTLSLAISTQQQASQPIPKLSSPALKLKDPSPRTILERMVIHRTRKDSEEPSQPTAEPKKKKRKTSRNEIDDIFGF